MERQTTMLPKQRVVMYEEEVALLIQNLYKIFMC